MTVKRVSVECVDIQDTPGSLQELLQKAAAANVDFACFAAFSTGTGTGRVYLAGKDPQSLSGFLADNALQATAAAGFIITDDDRVGAAAGALKGLAEAGINGLAGSAIVCNGSYQLLVVVDAADADAAAKALGA